MTPEWLEALDQYMNLRQIESDLEDTHESHYDPEEFGCSCDQCKDYEQARRDKQVLMNRWGSTWAVQLSLRIEKEAEHA